MASRKKAKKAPKAKPAGAGKKTARKAVRRPAAKKSAKPVKAKKKAGAPARAGAAKNPLPKKKKPLKKKKIAGEGDYAASRIFLKDQAGFVKKNKARIPALGRAAEQALNGAQGASLRAAEAAAASHSRAGTGEATIEAAETEALDRNAN